MPDEPLVQGGYLRNLLKSRNHEHKQHHPHDRGQNLDPDIGMGALPIQCARGRHLHDVGGLTHTLHAPTAGRLRSRLLNFLLNVEEHSRLSF
jgi:hypothetical protein